MAAGVFIEEGVVEEKPGLIDGAVEGYQGALAQVPGALVHVEHLLEQGIVDLGLGLHGLAALEAEVEVFNELSLVAKGLGGVDNALGHAPLGGDEALLGGNVGVEEHALLGGLAAAAEDALGNETHGEVGTVGSGIVERFDAQAVEVVAARLEVTVVIFPGGDGILVHPGGGENGLPELLHGLMLGEVGEHLLGPGRAGHGGDAPLVLALDLVAVGLDDGILSLASLGHLGEVHALEAVGILGDQVEAAGEVLSHILEPGLLIGIHRGEGLHRAMAHMELGEGLVGEVHDHLPGAGLVELVGDHGHKFGLIQLGLQKYILPLLDIAAHPGDEAGILLESGFLHKNTSWLTRKPKKSWNIAHDTKDWTGLQGCGIMGA